MTVQLSIAIIQLNPVVGDLQGNALKLRQAWEQARDLGADLAVSCEMSLTGYSPDDLVLRPAFQSRARTVAETLARETKDGPGLIIGAPWVEEGALYNASLLLSDGEIAARYRKRCLPNYGVFDEKRVFRPGTEATHFSFRGLGLGFMICEDVWHADAAEDSRLKGADILIAPTASPFRKSTLADRWDQARARGRETGLPTLMVNQLGGQDEVVFDGASFAMNADGSVGAQAPAWEEGVYLTKWRRTDEGWRCEGGPQTVVNEDLESYYNGVMTGLRDYVEKNNFPGVVLGLSGGIDSALTAAFAVDALGADRVRCVMMPSRYTSDHSLEDAKACAGQLGAEYSILDVEQGVEAVGGTLADAFSDRGPDVTEENIQSRLRGLLLMALSNKFGHMVLATGNKSELATGYATLYGDMCGGYAPLKDLYKMEVFALSRWRNENKPKGARGPDGLVIPERIITKPPSAELREDQRDDDSLPPYETLDAVLEGLIEENLSVDDIAARGVARETVRRIESLLYAAEYKRRQGAPGPKISQKSFGRDRRFPITNRYRD